MFLIENCLIDFADMVWMFLRTFAFGMKNPVQTVLSCRCVYVFWACLYWTLQKLCLHCVELSSAPKMALLCCSSWGIWAQARCTPGKVKALVKDSAEILILTSGALTKPCKIIKSQTKPLLSGKKQKVSTKTLGEIWYQVKRVCWIIPHHLPYGHNVFIVAVSYGL